MKNFLICIAIIALGILVIYCVMQVLNLMDDNVRYKPGGEIASIEDIGLERYNDQFRNYIGESKRASEAKSLINKVISNNTKNPDNLISIALEAGGSIIETMDFTYDVNELQKMEKRITDKNTLYIISIEEYDMGTSAVRRIRIKAVEA